MVPNLAEANIVCLCGKSWVEKTRHTVAKDQGGMRNFLRSYGLKPIPDGYEEGNAILDAMIDAEREEFLRSHKDCHLSRGSLWID